MKLYKSYWHSKVTTKGKAHESDNNYFTAIPNPGAGIGHQLANWIAGYWFAGLFGLKFSHFPFSSPAWENYFGFGQNEETVSTLQQKGYTKVQLPLFRESDKHEVATIKKIIQSYNHKKTVFVAEQDQYYKAQYEIMDVLKHKFYNAPARKDNKLIFSPEHQNIAIHVRRGDIVTAGNNKIFNKSLRFQENDYFIKVLANTINNIKLGKKVAVYLFSQGKAEDFRDFQQFDNIQFCLEMNALDSFNHMVYADILITSKSSFSYKAALLNNGLKICPKEFWHGYPLTNDFILAEEDGSVESKKFLLWSDH
ncbi:MAG: hypothetical protein QM763_20420 [Agriterribacter sp.]